MSMINNNDNNDAAVIIDALVTEVETLRAKLSIAKIEADRRAEVLAQVLRHLVGDSGVATACASAHSRLGAVKTLREYRRALGLDDNFSRAKRDIEAA